MSLLTESPAESRKAYGEHAHPRKGFFTDTSICIGCKACEVACKEWNRNPQDGDLTLTGESFDNTSGLGANTWRHVAFVEQTQERIEQARESGRKLVSLGMPTIGKKPGPLPYGGTAGADLAGVDVTPPDTPEFRWLMSSDVCKHCSKAGCLDVCPTGALYRTEHGTVVVQQDICNGCGTCVGGCPFGVIERRDDGLVNPGVDRVDQEVLEIGTAHKCTMCYDRMVEGEVPACAKTCPTQSIKYGTREEMVASARERVKQLHAQGLTEARLYGANPNDGVGGTGSVFLLLDEPEVYGLPPDPIVPTANLPQLYARAIIAAGGLLATTALAFMGGRK